MDWAQLIIVAIFVVVGVGSTILSQIKEQRARQQNQPSPRETPTRDTQPGDRPPRRFQPRRDGAEQVVEPTTSKPEDDDKYREEMGRKREAKRAQASAPPRPRPRRNEAKRPPPLPVPPPLPTVMPVLEFPPLRETVVVQPIMLERAQQLPAPRPLPVNVQAGAARPAPAAIRNVLELLKKRENLAAAILLREIVDPLCKRRHRS